jgi:hypothetical protein
MEIPYAIISMLMTLSQAFLPLCWRHPIALVGWTRLSISVPGGGVSLRELISLLMHILDKPIEVHYKPARDFDVRANVLDITRARSILDWSPRTSLKEGLSRFIGYLNEHLLGWPKALGDGRSLGCGVVPQHTR